MASFEVMTPKKIYLKLSKLKIALINFKVLPYNDKLFKEINNMKYYTKLFLTSVATLSLLTACGSKTENKTNSKTDTAETSQSLQTSTAETVEFFADGEYEVGTDVKPGSYYVVLTEFQPENEYDDVYFIYGKNIDVYDDNSDYESESLKMIGKPYKITFKEGMKFSFGSDDGISNWNVSFFTADDYKEYQKSEKK